MSRSAREAELGDMAQEMIRQARTIDELRQAQAVVFPPAYGMSLERHGWRKLAADKQHPQSDPVAQVGWKRNSPKRSPN